MAAYLPSKWMDGPAPPIKPSWPSNQQLLQATCPMQGGAFLSWGKTLREVHVTLIFEKALSTKAEAVLDVVMSSSTEGTPIQPK